MAGPFFVGSSATPLWCGAPPIQPASPWPALSNDLQFASPQALALLGPSLWPQFIHELSSLWARYTFQATWIVYQQRQQQQHQQLAQHSSAAAAAAAFQAQQRAAEEEKEKEFATKNKQQHQESKAAESVSPLQERNASANNATPSSPRRPRGTRGGKKQAERKSAAAAAMARRATRAKEREQNEHNIKIKKEDEDGKKEDKSSSQATAVTAAAANVSVGCGVSGVGREALKKVEQTGGSDLQSEPPRTLTARRSSTPTATTAFATVDITSATAAATTTTAAAIRVQPSKAEQNLALNSDAFLCEEGKFKTTNTVTISSAGSNGSSSASNDGAGAAPVPEVVRYSQPTLRRYVWVAGAVKETVSVGGCVSEDMTSQRTPIFVTDLNTHTHTNPNTISNANPTTNTNTNSAFKGEFNFEVELQSGKEEEEVQSISIKSKTKSKSKSKSKSKLTTITMARREARPKRAAALVSAAATTAMLRAGARSGGGARREARCEATAMTAVQVMEQAKVKVLGMAAEEAALAGAPEALAALKAVNSRTRDAMLVVAVAEHVVVTVGKLWFELCMEVLHRCNRAVEKVVDGGAMAAVQARC